MVETQSSWWCIQCSWGCENIINVKEDVCFIAGTIENSIKPCYFEESSEVTQLVDLADSISDGDHAHSLKG